MKPVNIPNKQILTEVIKKDEYAVGALIHLYQFQTTDEQISRSVKEQNGRGFNGTDGLFCSSLAEQYQSKGKLTTRQLDAVRKCIPKYHGQIDILNPLPIKKLRKRINKKSSKVVKSATLVGDVLEISFPFDFETVGKVKLISGRKWDAKRKIWMAPLCMDSIDDLLGWDFQLCSNAKKWIKSQNKKVVKIKEVPGLRATLFPYQMEGVSYIESRNGRAIVGDEMGLGKTIQALAWLQLNKEKDIFPVLVICPSSLKLNWSRETLKFTDLEPAIISGRKEKTVTLIPGYNNPNIFMINYDILHEMVKCPKCEGSGKISGSKCPDCKGTGKLAKLDSWIKEKGFKTVIMDECHYTKNPKTGRTKAALELSKDCDNVIGLSGTPITNRPIEFFNIINMVNSAVFPSWWKYTGRYCNRMNTGFGVDVSGSSNTKELHQKLTKSIMIRRLKENVLTELPPKIRSVVPISIDNKKYDRIMENTKLELENDPAGHLVTIERAKQLVVELKIDSCLEWIQEYIDNDEKLVVFADHKEVIEKVHKHFGKQSVVVYGGTNNNKRQIAVDSFQNDPDCKIFIGSKSAKEGLTLTAAKATCFLELWWTPGDHDQAEDRVHRIGQTSDSVMAYYLLAENTIEEDISQLLDSKRHILSSVLDGKDVEEVKMLSELIKLMAK